MDYYPTREMAEAVADTVKRSAACFDQGGEITFLGHEIAEVGQ